jgi:hypothetical protein
VNLHQCPENLKGTVCNGKVCGGIFFFFVFHR